MKKKKFKTKKIIIIALIIIGLVFLFPYKNVAMNDGGTMVFKSLVYEIKKIHRWSGYDGSYANGIVVKIFGKPVYKYFNPELIIHDEKKELTELYTLDENTKVFAEMEIEYRYKKEKMSLKEALEKEKVFMPNLVFFMGNSKSLHDAKVGFYESNDFLAKKNFYIVECKGNYYIGLTDDILSYCEMNE